MKLFFVFVCNLGVTLSIAQVNTNISNMSNWDTEPSIAVNPVNANNLVAAWMRQSGFTLAIGTSYSNDGGVTWSAPAVMPHLHPGFTMADVSLTFGSGGVAYMSYIDYAVTKDSGYVMMSKSLDGGQNWSTPVKVTSGLETTDIPIDRPWIAIDNSGGVYNGRIYIVSKSVDIGTFPHHIWMKYSADDGATWSALKLMDDSIPSNLITNAMGALTVGADGAVYVGYVSYNPTQFLLPRMVCLKSSDGGLNFNPKIIGYPVSGSSITDSLFQGSYVLSANPTDAGNLVFTFNDQRNGDVDVLSVHSNDGGTSWTSSPLRVNDDALSNGNGQDMAWAGFSISGKYAVAWRDRRNTGGTSTSGFEIYAGVSTDGGTSFTPNVKLSSAVSPFINIQQGNDFVGICLNDSYVYADWCDLRSGNTEIFMNRSAMSLFTGINEVRKEDRFWEVYPNPSNGLVTLKFELASAQSVSLELIDNKGMKVMELPKQYRTTGKQELALNLEKLPSGSYQVVLRLESGTAHSVQLVKQK